MKKFIAMMMVIALLVLGLTAMAYGESAADTQMVKTYTTITSIEGRITLSQIKDENGYYPAILELDDGREIAIPLTEEEAEALILKALNEAAANRKQEEKAKARESYNWLQKAGDWITFWD